MPVSASRLGTGQPSLGQIIHGPGRASGLSFQVDMLVLGGSEYLQQVWWGGELLDTGTREVGALRLHYAHSADFLWACVVAPATQDLQGQGQALYQLLLQTVQDLGKPHLLRLWNYLPRINVVEQGEERYRTFNRGRRGAFRAAGYSVAEGAPAACALGTQQGSLQVALLAGRYPVTAIENPRQISAYHYPEQYGVEPPLFSRAAWFRQTSGRDLLFISGTASIVGHETVHPDDVLAQTLESVRNIEAVLQSANEKAGKSLWRLQDLSGCVYLRQAADYPGVRACLEGLGLTAFAYVQADVCRSDLLVEIEAEAQLGLSGLPQR